MFISYLLQDMKFGFSNIYFRYIVNVVYLKSKPLFLKFGDLNSPDLFG